MNTPFDASFDALVQAELEKHKVLGVSISIVHGNNTYTKVRPTTARLLPNSRTRHTGWPNCQINP